MNVLSKCILILDITSLFFQSAKILTKTTQVVIKNVHKNVAVADAAVSSPTRSFTR